MSRRRGTRPTVSLCLVFVITVTSQTRTEEEGCRSPTVPESVYESLRSPSLSPRPPRPFVVSTCPVRRRGDAGVYNFGRPPREGFPCNRLSRSSFLVCKSTSPNRVLFSVPLKNFCSPGRFGLNLESREHDFQCHVKGRTLLRLST